MNFTDLVLLERLQLIHIRLYLTHILLMNHYLFEIFDYENVVNGYYYYSRVQRQ